MGDPLALSDFLAEVEKRLLSHFQLPQRFHGRRDMLTEAAKHLVLLPGGKRGRPILVHTFAQALGTTRDEAVFEIATAAELMHSASLLHDDVVDGGMFRRGRPTANAQWGNVVAVMGGDLLLSGALLKVSQAAPKVISLALSVVQEMTHAAIAEVESRGNVDHSEEVLERVAQGKTGSLFGFCGKGPALVQGDEKAAECFDAFGRRLGVAFQIADDIRDVTGADPGKPRYADIVSRTPSLPIVLAMKDEKLKQRFREAWALGGMSAEKAKELGTALWCTGAIDEAIAKMEFHLAHAVDALGPYRDGPVGEQLVLWASSVARGLALKDAA